MPSPTKPLRKRWLIYTFAAIVVVGAVAVVLMTPRRETGDKFVWMTSAQLAQTLKPGMLTRIKYQILRWPGPWRWFQSHKPVIQIDVQVLDIPNGRVLAPLAQVDSCWTNHDNQVAWIVGTDELKNVNQALKGPEVKGDMRLTVADGMQAAIATGTAIPATSLFCGTSAQLLSKIDHGKFKLLVQATSTEPAPVHPLVTASMQTNLSIACRALVPNGGALIIEDCANRHSGTNCCMIISCVAIDPKGNPVKLEK